MEKNSQMRNSLEEHLNSYHEKLRQKSKYETEITELKIQISKLQEKQNELSSQMNDDENIVQIEIYESYSHKDLLKMATYIEKHAKQEVHEDFKSLTNKFCNHDLEINDITDLQRYVKTYGPYVKEEHGLLRGIFGALGGRLDD